MSLDTSTLLALKNAWNGTIAASDRLRELSPAIQALGDQTPIGEVDFETYHAASMAQAIAAQALRGLVEELQRKSAPPASS
jgi:hypothetical protein